MKLEIEFFSSFCETSEFKINDVYADSYDFGEKRDHNPRGAEDYGCGNMRFIRKPANPYVLSKYGITSTEYELIAGQLEVGLSFGKCGCCV